MVLILIWKALNEEITFGCTLVFVNATPLCYTLYFAYVLTYTSKCCPYKSRILRSKENLEEPPRSCVQLKNCVLTSRFQSCNFLTFYYRLTFTWIQNQRDMCNEYTVCPQATVNTVLWLLFQPSHLPPRPFYFFLAYCISKFLQGDAVGTQSQDPSGLQKQRYMSFVDAGASAPHLLYSGTKQNGELLFVDPVMRKQQF